jgi:hypothetical protein
MSLATISLGERIVLVARLATEAHLALLREEENQIGRRRTAGGAGASRVTDDTTSPELQQRAAISALLAEGEVVE